MNRVQESFFPLPLTDQLWDPPNLPTMRTSCRFSRDKEVKAWSRLLIFTQC